MKRTSVLSLSLLAIGACSSSQAPSDAGGEADSAARDSGAEAATLDAADATPDGNVCLPPGSPCTDPFKCCSQSCFVEVSGNVCAD